MLDKIGFLLFVAGVGTMAVGGLVHLVTGDNTVLAWGVVLAVCALLTEIVAVGGGTHTRR